MPAPPDAVILCGGLGTRLQTAVSDRPKPMAEVGGKPFLAHLIDHWASFGITRFILCIAHKGSYIRERLASDASREIVYSEEKELLGTAGALRLALPLVSGERALVANGDSFCPLDPSPLLAFHLAKKARATIALSRVEDRAEGGSVELSEDDRVLAFREKAPGGPGWLNAGVYVLEREVLAGIPGGRAVSIEREIFPGLIGRGLYGWKTEAPVHDIGTPERLERFRRGFTG